MRSATHEAFSRDEKLAPGSERAFGTVMAAVLVIISGLNFWFSGGIWPWTLGGAALFLVTAGLWPAALKPLNRAWFKLGLLMHRVVNPIVMGLLFYLGVFPTGLVIRAFGKDPLRLRREPQSGSYWIPRQPRGPAPESMKDQF